MHYLYRYVCILNVFFICVYGQLSRLKLSVYKLNRQVIVFCYNETFIVITTLCSVYNNPRGRYMYIPCLTRGDVENEYVKMSVYDYVRDVIDIHYEMCHYIACVVTCQSSKVYL